MEQAKRRHWEAHRRSADEGHMLVKVDDTGVHIELCVYPEGVSGEGVSLNVDSADLRWLSAQISEARFGG